jgi:hypothetical protein
MGRIRAICADGAHRWRMGGFTLMGHRPHAVVNETRRVCEACGAEWWQLEVIHFDQHYPGTDECVLTVEPGRGLVIPEDQP